MTKVALFPIPECVSFPGTVFPLHVFEPRYRAMVQYCIEHGMPIGVCHTQKLLSPARESLNMQEALHSNQATYKPYPVFSAGRCELVRVFEDGRMLINVHIAERYHALREVQTLPFSIYDCEVYVDLPLTEQALDEAKLLQLKILKRLMAITANSEQAQAFLGSPEWQSMDALAFSFELFGVLQLPAEKKQRILETRSATDRLETVLQILNN